MCVKRFTRWHKNGYCFFSFSFFSFLSLSKAVGWFLYACLHWPEAFNIILFPSILAAIFNRSRVSMCLSVCVCLFQPRFFLLSLSLCAFEKGVLVSPWAAPSWIQCNKNSFFLSYSSRSHSFFLFQPFFLCLLCLRKKWTSATRVVVDARSSTHDCMTLARIQYIG